MNHPGEKAGLSLANAIKQAEHYKDAYTRKLNSGEKAMFSLQGGWNYWLRLCDFELRLSERYKRYLSLTMIAPGKEPVSISRTIEDTVRTSDELADFNGSATLLMPETNTQGAVTAIRRFKTKCNGIIDLRFSVVTFPEDGKSADVLVEKAAHRLDRAKAGAIGEVVTSG